MNEMQRLEPLMQEIEKAGVETYQAFFKASAAIYLAGLTLLFQTIKRERR